MSTRTRDLSSVRVLSSPLSSVRRLSIARVLSNVPVSKGQWTYPMSIRVAYLSSVLAAVLVVVLSR